MYTTMCACLSRKVTSLFITDEIAIIGWCLLFLPLHLFMVMSSYRTQFPSLVFFCWWSFLVHPSPLSTCKTDGGEAVHSQQDKDNLAQELVDLFALFVRYVIHDACHPPIANLHLRRLHNDIPSFKFLVIKLSVPCFLEKESVLYVRAKRVS